MEELKERFPEGLDYAIVYDTTPFINESISEVFKTLRDAVILVAVVVLLVPAELAIGASSRWWPCPWPSSAPSPSWPAVGFSLNNLTLFGLVLAIGIVVDDAIVVVEAVEHHIEDGLAPREATIKAMEQVSGPVIAVGLVLTRRVRALRVHQRHHRPVLPPVRLDDRRLDADLGLQLADPQPGPGGPAAAAAANRKRPPTKCCRAWRFRSLGAWLGYEFSWPLRLSRLAWPARRSPGATPGIAGAVAARRGRRGAGRALVGWFLAAGLNRVLGWSFRRFNRGFDCTTGRLRRVPWAWLLRVERAGAGGLRRPAGADLVGLHQHADRLHSGARQGLPAGQRAIARRRVASSGTDGVMRRIEEHRQQDPKASSTRVAIAGQSILLNANAPNFGAMYVMLDDFHHRRRPRALRRRRSPRSCRPAPGRDQGQAWSTSSAPRRSTGWARPAASRSSSKTAATLGLRALQQAGDQIVEPGEARPAPARRSSAASAPIPPGSTSTSTAPQAKTMGVSIDDVFNTLQVYLRLALRQRFQPLRPHLAGQRPGRGRFPQGRRGPQAAEASATTGGTMVPLGTMADVRAISGPVMIIRYNMYASAPINGTPAPGVSSGEAIEHDAAAARRTCRHTMRTEWTELAMLQLQTGNTAMLVFILAVVLVFLVLAAQYESWSLPLAVILVVPMCLLCSVTGVALARMDINIFTQIGFVVLVGLACKNAILIVEFAKHERESGASGREATLAACQLRLRPIVMTSLAFIIGVIPLAISVGAGAELRRTLGTAVFSGMLGVTLFGIFLTPVFFYVIQWCEGRWRARSR